ncbi:MAG: glycosyltransferase family 2 protein [Hyphomonadaceae bacterium]
MTQPPEALATIIIVSFNTRRFLARQMAALTAQTEQRFDLIVLDNASAPEERPRADELLARARLMQNERNLGFAGGVNSAVKGVRTPFIALLNPDAFPEPSWLAELLAAAERWPEAAAFGATQLRDETPGVLDGAGDEYAAWGFPYRALYGKRGPAPPYEEETFSVCAAAALYRREIFVRLGGFDGRFFCYCEDVDLGYRLRLAGSASVQAPRAVVRHVGGAAGGGAFADFHGARNRLWTFVKNTPSPIFQALAPAHVLASLVLLALHAFDGRWRAQARGMWAGWRGLGPILRQRRALQAGRGASAHDIARALIWSIPAVARRARKRRAPTRPIL